MEKGAAILVSLIPLVIAKNYFYAATIGAINIITFTKFFPVKEYKLAIGWKIFLACGCIALMIAGLAWLIHTILNGITNAIYVIPCSLALIAAGAWLLRMTIIFKVVITSTYVSITDNGIKTLNLTDVSGFRCSDKFIIIEPNNNGKPTIKIPEYTQGFTEIAKWASTYFPDLDTLQQNVEEFEILSSEEFGGTIEERETKLESARKVSKILNAAGGGLLLWAWIWPEPYLLICLLCILFPLLALVVYKYFKGLIKIDDKKGSAYPSLFSLGLVPLGLCVRALLDFDISDYNNLFVATIIFAGIFTFVMALKQSEFNFNTTEGKTAWVATVTIGLAYGYGTTVLINCYKDSSHTTKYPAQVIRKYESGEHTSYNLVVTPWGNAKDTPVVTVGENLYNKCYPGKTIIVNLQQGRLHSAWYYITD